MAEQLRGMMPQPTIISAETSIRKGRCAHLCWQSSFARGANGMGAEADGVGLKFSLAKKLECGYLFFGLCRPLHAVNAVWLKSNRKLVVPQVRIPSTGFTSVWAPCQWPMTNLVTRVSGLVTVPDV